MLEALLEADGEATTTVVHIMSVIEEIVEETGSTKRDGKETHVSRGPECFCGHGAASVST